MNRYHHRLSTILGCNTNVQCGIDGAHMMYVTYYSTKNTQSEDKLAYCQVAKTLYARIRQQEEAQLDPELCIDAVQAPTPFCEGYRRLLSAVLSHTRQGHVVSAPMAWFIMRKGTRFLLSNDFGYVCLDGMLGRTTASRVAPRVVHQYFLTTKSMTTFFDQGNFLKVSTCTILFHFMTPSMLLRRTSPI
jgi:hypothetical protein